MLALPVVVLGLVNLDVRVAVAIGCCIQAAAMTFLPTTIACLPAVIYLMCTASVAYLAALDPEKSSPETVYGRYTARWPASGEEPRAEVNSPSDAANDSVVDHILSTRSDHPNGPFTSQFNEMYAEFHDMELDMRKSRVKYGYLGMTRPLIGLNEPGSLSMFWISYWKNSEGLRKFAAKKVHRIGWNKYNDGKYPQIGIMHESYVVPKGGWETMYHNFQPFGMGRTKFPRSTGSDRGDGKIDYQEPLVEAIGPQMETMFKRMGVVS